MAHPKFILLTLVIYHISTTHGASPPPPQPPPSNVSNGYLEAHNKARAEVGVSPLQWGDKLAKDASLLVRYQRDKYLCNFASIPNNYKYGANQIWSSGIVLTPELAVQSWVDEKMYYNHSNNSCAANEGDRCGAYTQVVWGKSVQLGCAQATCVASTGHKTTLTICFYYPPGNVVGESPY